MRRLRTCKSILSVQRWYGRSTRLDGEKVYVCGPREGDRYHCARLQRERIDGKAFVVPWSFVDTSMGILNVNLDEHMFDAELYMDELGLHMQCRCLRHIVSRTGREKGEKKGPGETKP